MHTLQRIVLVLLVIVLVLLVITPLAQLLRALF
jgi:hypothetical protein